MLIDCCYGVVFFFKQKTAYEMRISDWSSDVCSSDLRDIPDAFGRGAGGGLHLVVAGVGVGRQVADIGDVDDMGERPPSHVPGQIGRASCRERVCQYV